MEFRDCILPELLFKGKNVKLDPNSKIGFTTGYSFDLSSLPLLLENPQTYTLYIKGKDKFKKVITLTNDYKPEPQDVILYVKNEGVGKMFGKMMIAADGEVQIVDQQMMKINPNIYRHDYLIKWWTDKKQITELITEYKANGISPFWLEESLNL